MLDTKKGLREQAPWMVEDVLSQYFLATTYQVRVPWHPGEQERVVALKFKVLTTSFTPFLCVVAVTAVEL